MLLVVWENWGLRPEGIKRIYKWPRGMKRERGGLIASDYVSAALLFDPFESTL